MTKPVLQRTLVIVAIFAVLTAIMISVDAFEWFYGFSRDHEDWELDEFLVGGISAIVAICIWLEVEARQQSVRAQQEATTRLRIEQELAQSRRAQVMGTLAAGLAHSANNLLQPILTLSRVSLQQLEAGHPVRPPLEKVVEAADRAKAQFATVLRASREDEEKGGVEDAAAVIEANRPLFSAPLPSSISIKTTGEAWVPVPLPAADLSDFLLVLVSNAADAYSESGGGGGGEIRIRVSRDSQAAESVLTVEDDGKGISAADRDRMFEPFFTTKQVGQGTGLGLFIVAGLVERAGGRIDLTSEPGRGTTFRISFPAAARSGRSGNGEKS